MNTRRGANLRVVDRDVLRLRPKHPFLWIDRRRGNGVRRAIRAVRDLSALAHKGSIVSSLHADAANIENRGFSNGQCVAGQTGLGVVPCKSAIYPT